MKSFTLEWNAVITLEECATRPTAPAIRELLSLHGTSIDLGIVTTAASENTRMHQFPSTAIEFQTRLNNVGFGQITRVYTPAIIGLTYIGLSVIAPNDCDEMIGKIWNIVKPTHLPRSHEDFASSKEIAIDTPITSSEFHKWRNKWCDVVSLYAHILADRDVFVSGDVKNFHGERKDQLTQLGVKEICSYDEALEIAKAV